MPIIWNIVISIGETMLNSFAETRSENQLISTERIAGKPKVLFISSFPPPAAGVSNVMQGFWNSSLHEKYNLRRFDITRSVAAHVHAKLRLDNVIATITQCVRVLWICIEWQPRIINVIYTSKFAILKAMGFALIGRVCGTKVVGHLHGGEFDKFCSQQIGLLRQLIRLSLRPVDTWIVTASYWKDIMLSLGVSESCITIIPNPQREEVLTQFPKQNYLIKGDSPSLLFVGAVSHRKGVDVLIEALSLRYNEGKDFHAYILGGEENLGEKSEIQIMCCQYLPEKKIEFIERLEGKEYFDLLRSSDIFVLPSRNENYPMALCEAMALGLPVISTNVGGISDLIIDNENGLIIPPADASALFNAINRLADEFELRTRLGQTARSMVLRYLSPKRAIEKLGIVFQDLCL